MQAGNIGAVDVAEFALEAFINNLILLCWSQATRILIVVSIDIGKQSRKRCAVLKAQTTPVAEVVHARELFTQVGLIEVVRMIWIVSNGHVIFLIA